MAGQHELLRRQAATSATMAKYRSKAFDWRSEVTCVHMARFHLRKMGHKMPKVPQMRSEIGARHALKARGVDNVAEMLDALLPRIAPAEMLLGDLVVAGSADGIGAIFVCAGPQKIIGWREDEEKMVFLDITLGELDGAWRA
jgi:hypothetical protein